MKKFTSLLIGLSLALAGAAFAQLTEESPAPGKKQGTTEKAGKAHAEKTATANEPGAPTGAEQGTGKGHKGKAANAGETNVSGQTTGGVTTETGAGHKGKGRAKTEASVTGAGTETNVNPQTGAGATTETGMGRGKGKNRAKVETSTATGTSASAEASASATVPPTGKHPGRGEKGMKAGAGAGVNAKASAAPSASAAPTVAASTSAAPSVAATGATGQQNVGANANVAATGGTTKHVEKQKVEQVKQQTQTIKQQHVNFKAQPRPDKAPAVTFNVNYRIQGSDRWSGPQYEAFRSYHPERHDRNWYHSHHQRIELIAGGYYYWNNGYWYPAWGYDPGQEYYAYDAPIYVGHRAEPPDRVIADVQTELQQMGYYQGDVDGLLGPLTRQALTDYQADQGLQVTAVIDEPTLDSLGMG
jgi:putative peptidoglycan binding protein